MVERESTQGGHSQGVFLTFVCVLVGSPLGGKEAPWSCWRGFVVVVLLVVGRGHRRFAARLARRRPTDFETFAVELADYGEGGRLTSCARYGFCRPRKLESTSEPSATASADAAGTDFASLVSVTRRTGAGGSGTQTLLNWRWTDMLCWALLLEAA